MSEAVRHSPEENKASDVESIKSLCTNLVLDNVRVQTPVQIGQTENRKLQTSESGTRKQSP